MTHVPVATVPQRYCSSVQTLLGHCFKTSTSPRYFCFRDWPICGRILATTIINAPCHCGHSTSEASPQCSNSTWTTPQGTNQSQVFLFQALTHLWPHFCLIIDSCPMPLWPQHLTNIRIVLKQYSDNTLRHWGGQRNLF